MRKIFEGLPSTHPAFLLATFVIIVVSSEEQCRFTLYKGGRQEKMRLLIPMLMVLTVHYPNILFYSIL